MGHESTLNLSLQNVSLVRNRMEEAGNIVKGKKLWQKLGRQWKRILTLENSFKNL